MMYNLSVAAFAIALAFQIVVAQDHREAEPSAAGARAVAMIKKLGGQVRGDAKRPFVEVDLGGTNVAGADLQLLKDLPDLRVLDLHNTKITDKGLEHLKDLVNLQGLHLHAEIGRAHV